MEPIFTLGHKLSNLSRGPLEDDSQQTFNLYALCLLTIRFSYISLCKIKWTPQWGQYWPWGHNLLHSIGRGPRKDATHQYLRPRWLCRKWCFKGFYIFSSGDPYKGSITIIIANSNVTITRMLLTKFEVNLTSSFRGVDQCWRWIIPSDTNSSPWTFGSGELIKKPTLLWQEQIPFIVFNRYSQTCVKATSE